MKPRVKLDMTVINFVISYVTPYATLSHLYNDNLANQRQLKWKQLSTNMRACYCTNVKVSRRLLRIQIFDFFVRWPDFDSYMKWWSGGVKTCFSDDHGPDGADSSRTMRWPRPKRRKLTAGTRATLACSAFGGKKYPQRNEVVTESPLSYATWLYLNLRRVRVRLTHAHTLRSGPFRGSIVNNPHHESWLIIPSWTFLNRSVYDLLHR